MDAAPILRVSNLKHPQEETVKFVAKALHNFSADIYAGVAKPRSELLLEAHVRKLAESLTEHLHVLTVDDEFAGVLWIGTEHNILVEPYVTVKALWLDPKFRNNVKITWQLMKIVREKLAEHHMPIIVNEVARENKIQPLMARLKGKLLWVTRGVPAKDLQK